jgi:hypothetical protein
MKLTAFWYIALMMDVVLPDLHDAVSQKAVVVTFTIVAWRQQSAVFPFGYLYCGMADRLCRSARTMEAAGASECKMFQRCQVAISKHQNMP